MTTQATPDPDHGSVPEPPEPDGGQDHEETSAPDEDKHPED